MENQDLKFELLERLQDAVSVALLMDDADGVMAKMALMNLIHHLKSARVGSEGE